MWFARARSAALRSGGGQVRGRERRGGAVALDLPAQRGGLLRGRLELRLPLAAPRAGGRLRAALAPGRDVREQRGPRARAEAGH